jgi:3-hydroxyisobutyrate dehydrogenase-like beta-hydroxyacid dehydrogenase
LSRVAVIGLGRMGGPIADHIIGAGHDVTVFDVSHEAMAPRVAAGARPAASAADAADGATVVCVVVLDDEQAVDVVTGEHGVLRALAPGGVVCIHSTVRIDTIDALHERGESAGVSVIDAGISGGEQGARSGTLLTMVGGDAAAVERARPVLAAFSKEVLHAGPVGAGMALKLARNAAFYGLMAVIHESIELATRAGVDKAMLRHAIETTAAFEHALTPFDRDLTGASDSNDAMPVAERRHVDDLAKKDLDQALALGAHVDATTEVLEQVRRSFHHVLGL